MLGPWILRGLFEGAEGVGRVIFTKGYEHMGTGAVFGKPVAGLVQGYKTAYMGAMPFVVGAAAFMGAVAPRHHKLSATAATLAAPLGTVLGGLIGGPVGALAGSFVLDPLVQSTLAKPIQKFSEFGRQQRAMNFGSFNDSETRYTMRARASQEMSRSLLNCRDILGKEAVLFHQ